MEELATPAKELAEYDAIDDSSGIFMPMLIESRAKRVLIADDDPLMREHLSALASKAGFDVATAATGKEALASMQSEYSPIVLSDLRMPDMDGVELCRAIRRTTFPGYVYVVLLTAHDAQRELLAGFEAGADDYVSKNVSEAELVARLRTAHRVVAVEQTLRASLEEKRRQAQTDALTDCYNRYYFSKHLARELKRSQRIGDCAALLLFDIDRFKSVNDRYGHAVGDEVLVEFASRLRSALVRECDWSARIGGEEFVAVLPGTDLQGARVVAEKIRRRIAEQPIPTQAGHLAITVSIGAAVYDGGNAALAPHADTLLEWADRNLYRSKLAGRNRVTAAVE